MKTKLTKLKWKHFVFLSILSFSTNFVNASSKEDISETESEDISGTYIEESSESFSGKSGECIIVDSGENLKYETPKPSQPIYIPEVIYIEESPNNNNNNNKRYEIQKNEKYQIIFTEGKEKHGRSDSDESYYEFDPRILEESRVNFAKALSLQEQNNKLKKNENKEYYNLDFDHAINESLKDIQVKHAKEIVPQKQNTKSKIKESEEDNLEYYNAQIREFEEKEEKTFTKRSQDLLSNYTKKNRLSPEKSLSNKKRENKK